MFSSNLAFSVYIAKFQSANRSNRGLDSVTYKEVFVLLSTHYVEVFQDHTIVLSTFIEIAIEWDNALSFLQTIAKKFKKIKQI